jgi:phospholipase/lecithinase/hemolysin
MGSKIKKVLAFWFLCVSLILSTAVLGNTYSNILSFGDSLSDNGVHGSTNGTTTNTNMYDGFGIKYYTNGPVWVENMASTYPVCSFWTWHMVEQLQGLTIQRLHMRLAMQLV